MVMLVGLLSSGNFLFEIVTPLLQTYEHHGVVLFSR